MVPMKVQDVMVQEVVTVDPQVTVKRAVEIMNEHEIGCLIVVKHGRAIGIVTERDILTRVLVESRSPEKTRMREIMSTPPIVAHPSMDLEEATRLMFKTKVKKLPVVFQKKLVGLVTLTDIARFQPELMRLLKKKQLTQPTPKRMKKVIDYYIV